MTAISAGRDKVLGEVWFSEKSLKILLGAEGAGKKKREMPLAT